MEKQEGPCAHTRARRRGRQKACWLVLVGSCDLSSKVIKKTVQIPMLPWGWLAPVHGARSHVVDELVMLVGKAVLLTLAVERDLGPFERAVGVTKRAGAVLLAFRRLHTLGVTNGARVLDRGADLLLVGLAQAAPAVLDVIGEVEKATIVFLQFARHCAHGGKSYALIV